MDKLSQAIWTLVNYAQRSESSSEDVSGDAHNNEDVDVNKKQC